MRRVPTRAEVGANIRLVLIISDDESHGFWAWHRPARQPALPDNAGMGSRNHRAHPRGLTRDSKWLPALSLEE